MKKAIRVKPRRVVLMSGTQASTRINARNQKIIKPIKGKAPSP